MDRTSSDILVIFDLDGTLFETGSSVVPAVNDSLRDIGMDTMDEKDILFLLGERTPIFCEKVVGGRGEKYEDFRERLWHYEHKYIGEKGRLFKGTESMLKDLKKKGF
ncbi:MAG: HAD family hydrolase, partial [Thermoplasmatota archaeon]